MRVIIRNIFMFLAAFSSLIFQVVAEEDNQTLEFELSSSFVSSYFYRGFTLYDGAAWQPAISGTYNTEDMGSFSGLVWSSIVVEQPAQEGTFTEVDYDLSWSNEFGKFSIALGHLWYTYPSDRIDVATTYQEIYLSMSYDTILNPVLTVFHDYAAFDIQTYELGFSHEFQIAKLGESFNIAPYTNFIFATNTEKLYDRDGLLSVLTGISFSAELGDVSVVPSVNYNFKVDNNTEDHFWFELGMFYNF